jgi:hypothetical protein
MKHLFAKIINIFVFALFAVGLLANQFVPVSALTEEKPAPPPTPVVTPVPAVPCNMGPLNPIGPAPLTVHFDASASKASGGYSWFTADENHTGGDATFDHAFKNPGTYKVRLICFNVDGTFSYVTTWVTVLAPDEDPTVTVTPLPNGGGLPATGSCSNTTGNDNIVICADNGSTVNVYPEGSTPPATPNVFEQLIAAIANWISRH